MSRARVEDQRAGASNRFFCYFCKKPGHIKKNCMKYKEMLNRKGDKDSNRASTSRKSDQAGVVEEADEGSCNILRLSQEKITTQMLDYLTRSAHTTYAQKESGLILISLMMEALS